MKRNWSAFVGIPAWILLVNLLNLSWYKHSWLTYWITSLLIIGYIFFFWQAGLWWVKRVQTWMPAINQTRQRMLLTFGGYLLGVLSTQALLLWGISRLELLNLPITSSIYIGQAFAGILAVVLTGGIYEFTYYFGQYQRAVEEAKITQKALYSSQLEALKQQVNPHFLFNSLNILDALIEDNPEQARVFLDELSTVYRYLLRSNRSNNRDAVSAPERDSHLTELSAELEFINSYFHLLKTRHGSGLSLNVTVDDRYQTYQIPPLTLQLLVENAVKHNVVLPEQPLTIQITTDNDAYLTVRNNIQRKSGRVASNGVGLTNILTTYQMLGQPAPKVEEADGQFVVTLPLIRQS